MKTQRTSIECLLDRMDNHVMAAPSPTPSNNIPRSEYMCSPGVSESGCNYIQRAQSDQNAISCSLLLPPNEKETIIHANVVSNAAIDGSVGHGTSIALGHVEYFILDE